MKKLNINQQKFVEEYAKLGNETEAYRLAYPSAKKEEVIRANASRLLTNANVREYLEELKQKTSSENIADMQEVKEFWTTIIRNPNERTDNRLKASDMIAKTNGAYLQKIDLKTTAPVQIVDNIRELVGDDGTVG